jgi:selenocysteine lyase/cysteine desulfurase
MPNLDLPWIRSQFPSLALEVAGKPAAYFDGPGGTQTPQQVIDAIRGYLMTSTPALWRFLTGERTGRCLPGTPPPPQAA